MGAWQAAAPGGGAAPGAQATAGAAQRSRDSARSMKPKLWLIHRMSSSLRRETCTISNEAAAVKDAPAERRFLDFGIHARTGKVLNTYEITGTIQNPQTIEIHATGAMKYYILMLHGTEEGVLDTISTVQIAGVSQEPYKIL